jgi:hypothetical protein
MRKCSQPTTRPIRRLLVRITREEASVIWKIVVMVLATLFARWVATTLFLNRGLPKNDVAIEIS